LPSHDDVKFTDFPLLESIQESIRQAGYERPTPVQASCLTPALEGKDVIGLAQTGTGKTAAFAIPIIQRLSGKPDLSALVLAPTRELAAQITAVFNQLGALAGVRVATIVGGVPMSHDYTALTSWPNVLIATPGRLIDHIENNDLSLNEIEILAVDEADRMHDMGFIPQIRRILAVLPPKRQTLMFTATMPPDVERIARKSMNNPVRIQCGQVAPANRARQELYELSEEAKTPLLLDLLTKSTGRVLVFLRTKRGVDRVARHVASRRFQAARIHGDLEQVYRDKALQDFRTGACRILIATDIAARGLDVSGIEHVINFDFPHQAEDYVHRIGRTARVDASGLASSFVTRGDRRFVAGVRELIGDKLPQPIRLESYGDAPAHSEIGHGGHGGGDARKSHAGRGGSRGGRGARPGRGAGQSRQTSHKTHAGQAGQAGQVSPSEFTGGVDEQAPVDLVAPIVRTDPDGDAVTTKPKRRRRRGGRSGKNKGNQPAGNTTTDNQQATQDQMPD
jgi:ATP-dependent RNA helicase RhlE